MTETLEDFIGMYQRKEMPAFTLSMMVVGHFLSPTSLDEVLAALPLEARKDLEEWLERDDFAESRWFLGSTQFAPPPGAVEAAELFRRRKARG